MRAGDLEGLGGTPALRFMTGSVWPLDIAGTELGARGDSVVGGGDDIVGQVDQSSPGWLWQRDQLIGRDLAARGPGDAFVAGLALLDRDLGLSLGSHADEARRSREAWVVGRGVADDVGDVDRGDHAEVKGLDRFWEVEAAGELVGVAHPVGLVAVAAIAARTSLAAATSAGSVRLAGLVSSPQRFAARLHATWLASSAGISRCMMSLPIWPFLAAASVRMPVVLVMSAWTRATLTRSAGSGLLARVRCA
jgi:hypothetical protein